MIAEEAILLGRSGPGYKYKEPIWLLSPSTKFGKDKWFKKIPKKSDPRDFSFDYEKFEKSTKWRSVVPVISH